MSASHPAGQRVGYARVSTVDQTTARQLDGQALDRLFTDKASGSSTDRPQLQAALAYVRAGDTLVVHSMDRLARNLADLLAMVKELTERGVTVEFIKERQTYRPSDQADPMADLLLQVMGAFAQFERALIRERQREGIALAKTVPGKYRGRAQALSPEKVQELLARDAAQAGKGRTALAKEYGISRETLYQYLKKAEPAKDQAKL